ncbi:MAG: hypothetical protein KGJ02_04185 [Verrucomicrobiota bacterium]|nr:hypothetical protein [Verrucomicrobiota bacterium]
MKYIATALLVFSLSLSPLSSDEPPATPAPAIEETSENVGVAAATATSSASSNTWQNWIFAGGAATAAIIGIVIVAISQGNSAH